MTAWTRNAFDASVWAAAVDGSIADLSRAVAAAQAEATTGRTLQVTIETVFSESDHPFDQLQPRNADVERLVVGPVQVLRLTDDDGQWVLGAWPAGPEGVFHLVGNVPTTHPRWSKLDRWIGRARGILRCFLNHADFEDVGIALSEHGDVEVSRVTARGIHDQSSTNRGWPARTGASRPTPADAVAEAESRGAAVRTMIISIHDVLSLHLRRVSGATFYGGDFPLFEQVVLHRLARAAAGRRALMMDRRRTSTTVAPSITVRLRGAILQSAEDTGLLIEQCSSLPRVSLAVFHRNPYLHLGITDEVDGSNFDVLVTRNDAIDIYPGYRASMESLTRLAQVLGERFDADSIHDAPQLTLVSLDELANG